jgi:HTH-type transcriptional regulator, sugar sensing transcriptional regulator
MATNFLSLFTSLGLSESESKIYLASLCLGPTSVQSIAKEAKLSRTAAYDTVSSLQKRGLMSSFERGKKRFFVADNPDSALAHFRANVESMNDTLGKLDSNLNELKLKSGGEKPAVRFYEGDEAIYALFSDFVAVDPKQLDEVSNMDLVYSVLNKKILKDARKLSEKFRANVRILHVGKTQNPRKEIQYCELDRKLLGDFQGDIWIYEDRVAFVSYVGKVVTVIMENQTFADTARFLFNAAWQVCSAEKPKSSRKK